MQKGVWEAKRVMSVKSVVIAGIALMALGGCSSNWYPPEENGQVSSGCCTSYAEYPPYTSSYYEPAYPYGYSLGFHQHVGFSGSLRPGYRPGVNDWDGTGQMRNDARSRWERLHHNGSYNFNNGEGGRGGERHEGPQGYQNMQNYNDRGHPQAGAGQNENYDKNNNDNRPWQGAR